MKFHEKLIKLRKSKGLSQEELAEILNVSRQAISRWELGTTLPDVPNLLSISEIFGISTDYLVHDDYESDDDIPIAKEKQKMVEEKDETIVTTNNKHKKLHLISAAFFLLASISAIFSIIYSGNDTQQFVSIISATTFSALATVQFILYLKK